jgi:hypothetical protein
MILKRKSWKQSLWVSIYFFSNSLFFYQISHCSWPFKFLLQIFRGNGFFKGFEKYSCETHLKALIIFCFWKCANIASLCSSSNLCLFVVDDVNISLALCFYWMTSPCQFDLLI